MAILQEFQKWVSSKVNPGTSSNYLTFLGAAPSTGLTSLISTVNNLKPIGLPKAWNINDYPIIIEAFLAVGDGIYALTIYDYIEKLATKAKVAAPPAIALNLDNAISALHKFGEFVEEQALMFTPNASYNSNGVNLSVIKKSINKNMLHPLYAMDFLIFGNFVHSYDGFIKKAIESSLFFDGSIVVNRHNALVQKLANGNNLPARHSTDLSININNTGKGSVGAYAISGNQYNVLVDPDNNQKVRQLINQETGFTLSDDPKLLRNFIISHVWDNASDPRYFTNLWNIALIPAWANGLFDNPNLSTLAMRFKSTIMEICKKLYFKQGLNWAGLNMTQPKTLTRHFTHGIFDILVVGPKNPVIGDIHKVQIKI